MVADTLTVPSFPPDHLRERLQWLYEAGIDPLDLAGKIIVLAGYKGGIGKTTLAVELAYVLGAILVDFEWDEGGAAVSLGYRPDQHVRAPLIDAIQRERLPRVISGGPWRPDFVPGHQDFELHQPTADQTAELLGGWAAQWGKLRGCPIVVDTHPGGSPSTLGAISASHLTIAPAVFKQKEMRALEGMVRELAGYPLMVIPNMVPPAPPARFVDWLDRLKKDYQVRVGPVVSSYRQVPNRSLRMAVSAAGRPTPQWAEPMVTQIHKVGGRAVNLVTAT